MPYGVKVSYYDNETEREECDVIDSIYEDTQEIGVGQWCLKMDKFKPYLFPLSSMTDEQYNEFFAYYHNIEMDEVKASGDYLKAAYLGDDAKYEWLNRHNFDYRYLIEKGIAIDCTNLNIY